MRTVKKWSGVFHCPSCWVQVEIHREPSLECEFCGGRLEPGPLVEDPETEETEKSEDGT